jgi:hypothetical protein
MNDKAVQEYLELKQNHEESLRDYNQAIGALKLAKEQACMRWELDDIDQLKPTLKKKEKESNESNLRFERALSSFKKKWRDHLGED